MHARDGHVGPWIAHDAIPARARRVHAQDFLHRLAHQGWIADQAFGLGERASSSGYRRGSGYFRFPNPQRLMILVDMQPKVQKRSDPTLD